MKHTPITQLRPNSTFDSIYLVQKLEVKSKRTGEPFATLLFSDATGTLSAVQWDNLEPILSRKINVEDFVAVSGDLSLYNNSLQATVKRIEKMPDEKVDFSRFVPVTPRDRAELERALDARIAEVQNGDLRRLLEYLIGKNNSPGNVRADYLAAPAAVRVHQAYLGGLLEHTLNVCTNALALADRYKPYDRDLLITGALLHDIGKIREYEWRRAISYSDEGRMLGHIPIGSLMINDALRALAPFDKRLGQHILHLILSHHGKREYGSPVLPKTREAILLHYGDYTDAYLATFCHDIDEARALGVAWTPYNKLFDTYLYAGPTRSNEALPLLPGLDRLLPDDPRLKTQGSDAVDDPGLTTSLGL